MINEEKIRKYLDGELSGEELYNFENEINKSSSLRKEIEVFRNTIDQFKSLKDIKTDDRYFANILPHFHGEFAKKSQSAFRPSFATGSIAAVLIIAIVFLIINRYQQVEDVTLQSLNNEEINEYLNEYPNDISASQFIEDIPEDYDSLINTMMESELNLNEYREDYFAGASNDELNYLFDDLTNDEVEGIYNSLIKEDFN